MTEGRRHDAIIEYLESDERLKQRRDDETHGGGVQQVLPQQEGRVWALRAQWISPAKLKEQCVYRRVADVREGRQGLVPSIWRNKMQTMSSSSQ